MTNRVREILDHNAAATAPAHALLNRVNAMTATPPAVTELNRRVAAMLDRATIKKD